MATSNYNIDCDQSPQDFTSDLNDALAAILSQNSSTGALGTTVAYMERWNTATGIKEVRNAGDSAWVSLPLRIDGSLLFGGGSISAPGLSKTGDTNTGIASVNADELSLVVNATEKVRITVNSVTIEDELLLQAGTVSAPGLAAEGDTDTGVYWSGTNALALTTGGVQAVNITSAQDVSIPNGDLTVSGLVKAGSTPVTLTDAAGKLLLAALAQTSATTGDVLAWNGTSYAPTTPGSGGNVSTAGLTTGTIPYASGSATLSDGPITTNGTFITSSGKVVINRTGTSVTDEAGNILVYHNDLEAPAKSLMISLAMDTKLAHGIKVRKARGSHASPAESEAYDALGSWDIDAYINGEYRYVGGLRSTSEAAPSGNFMQSQFHVWTNDGATDTYPAMIWDSQQRVGIGNAHPRLDSIVFPTYDIEDWFTLKVDSGAGTRYARAIISQASDNIFAPELRLKKNRGTHETPAAVSNLTVMGVISAYGYQNSDYQIAGFTAFSVDGTPSGDNIPTRWSLHLATSGSAQAEKVYVSGTTMSAFADTDATTILGRMRVHSPTTDRATLSHFDQTGTGSYGVELTTAGATSINAATGQSVAVRVNNSAVALFSATSFALLNGAFNVGASGTTRGQLLAYHGSGGNQPGVFRIYSPNGTPWYVFVEDDGTLKVHSALPTANTDGTVVGSQS